MTLKEEALKKYGAMSLPQFFTIDRISEETGNMKTAGQMRSVVCTRTGRLEHKPFLFISECRGICTIKDLIKYIEKGKGLHNLPGIGRKTAKVFLTILDKEGLI